MQESVSPKKDKELLSLEKLNEVMEAGELEKAPYFPSIQWESKNTFSFQNGNTRVCFNIKDMKVSQSLEMPENAENADVSPKKDAIAYTIGNNLSYINAEKSNQITNHRDLELVAGQTVARNEFGIEKGIFWSPEGNKIAYYLKDESMVTDYPLVNITTRIATVDNTKYPMAGEKSEETKLHIFDLTSGNDIEVKTEGDPEQFLTNIVWSPDEKYVLIAVLNRAQNHMSLNMYNATNGKFVKTLFEETSDKYVEPQHPALFIPGENDKFIWQSRRDGYNHMYLYNTKGELLKQLTKGNWEVTEIIGFSPRPILWFFNQPRNLRLKGTFISSH